MATSKRTGGDYTSRRERGYRVTKYPKGYDRRGYPIICGLLDSNGNECSQPSRDGWGLCDHHWEERQRQLAGKEIRSPQDLDYVVTPVPKVSKKRRSAKRRGRRPVITVNIDPDL